MKTPRHNDDVERAFLDSIGISQKDSIPENLTDAEVDRAERMLAYITAQSRHTPLTIEPAKAKAPGWWSHRTWNLNLAAAIAICVLVAAVVVIHPWGRGPTAFAHTPPMLQFPDIRAGQIKTTGDPADDMLRHLAIRARDLPQQEDLPVQHVELAGWWASSKPADGSTQAVTALSPVHSNSYLLPNNDRRAIERRGKPLDADGKLVDADPNWAATRAFSDTTTELDPEKGVNYLSTLPETAAEIRKTLAPNDGCAETPGGCLLSSVSSLFETYVVPPEFASRLWETLAAEPTITSLGHTIDRLGRKAVAFTAPGLAPSEQLLLLINPENGQYLGSENILIKPDANFGFDPPAVIAFTYLLRAERIAASDVPDASASERY